MATTESKPQPKTAHHAATPKRRSGFLRPHVVGAVFGRNFLGYLSNPAGYVFITLFVLVCSWFEFWQPVFFTNNVADLHPLNEWMPYALLFFVPAITMSIWADERRQGTEELLLTLPARDVEVVLGKYLAALGIYTVSLAFLALGHVPVLMYLGRPDFGVLASTYFGYWLMGATLIAIGMVASILTTSATVGFILGALFCAIPVFLNGMGPIGQMIGMIARVPGFGWLAPEGSPGLGTALARGLESVSIPAQFRDFGTGVVSLVGVLYFVGLAAAMLYVNMILLGRRHWAGGEASTGRWLHALARCVAMVVALVCFDVLVGRFFNKRVDATEERLHSLSTISDEVARGVPSDRQVDIQFYYSPDVPREYVEVKADLTNTLKEFAANAGDRIRLNLIETRRFSPEARDAERRFGITPKRVLAQRAGRQETDEIFLGLAFTSGLEQVVIPFFDRGLPVEYELTRSIRVVSGSKRKRVGILDTDVKLLGRRDMRSLASDPEWAVVTELRKQYEVTGVSADAPIPFEEVQSISVSGEPTGGTFTLTFEGDTTTPLPHNADAQAIADALRKLPKIESDDITVSGGALPKTAVQITFTGRYRGKNVTDLLIDSKLTGADETKPTARVSVTTPILDALVVAQPASLKQQQMDNLTEYVRKGGPTLLLVDPMPDFMPMLAPLDPPVPDDNTAMGQPSEPKGDIRPLMELLGVNWPLDQIVWNPNNPHPQFQFPLELVFVTRQGGSSNAFAADPITTKLQELFFVYAGHIRSREMPNDPKVTPLLRTDKMGGAINVNELPDRSPFARFQPPRKPRYFASNEEYILAARVQGKMRTPEISAPNTPPPTASGDANVIIVADVDVISDQFFNLRRKPVEWLDAYNFDNVTFILNCVDSLTGDDTFIDLRKKRPTFRTLTRLEQESKKFISQSLAEEKKAEADATKQLDDANARLQEAVEGIRKSTEYDERTKESMVELRRVVEQRRLDLQKAEIDAQKEQAIRDSRDRREEAIASLQNGVRAFALIYPPLPALLLGAIVFVRRAGRENVGANPDRLA